VRVTAPCKNSKKTYNMSVEKYPSVLDLKQSNEWQNHYISAKGLVPAIQALGDNLRCLEIGVCRAENMVWFLEQCPNIKHMDGVDPYMAYHDANGGMTQDQLNSFLSLAQNNLHPFAERARLHRMRSDKFAQTVADHTYDVIFIDGDHSYDCVRNDLENFYPKVKSGGIFAGHDIGMPDVQRALMEFRAHNNLTNDVYGCAHDVWFWHKN